MIIQPVPDLPDVCPLSAIQVPTPAPAGPLWPAERGRSQTKFTLGRFRVELENDSDTISHALILTAERLFEGFGSTPREAFAAAINQVADEVADEPSYRRRTASQEPTRLTTLGDGSC